MTLFPSLSDQILSNSVAATQSPIIFIGTGEHLHDLDRFEPKPFVRKMLGMGDMRDLVEKVQDMKLDQNKNLMKNLESGMFTHSAVTSSM